MESVSQNKNSSPLLSDKAIEVAREAILEIAEGEVGAHIGVAGLSSNVATHRFEASVPGYNGWEWNAVVACATGSTWVTVNEVALMPARDALQAPDWVPYSERLRPGDLGPGDIMEPAPDDERLTTDSFAKESVVRRSSSGAGSMMSPGPRSPGRRRSEYGTQSGACSASRAGMSATSLTVTHVEPVAHATTAFHSHPL